MGHIPEDVIEKIVDATDIVDLIGGHVQLKRAGSTFKGLCPFHNEKTPSFNVSPNRQNYKCFGCGEGGNAIGWLMSYENLPFVDAVKKLASKANIIIREEVEDPQADKLRRRRSQLVDLNNKTARYYHHLAMTHPDAAHAREYLKSRGFDKEMSERWLIGWAPADQRVYFEWVKQQGFKGRDLVTAGLAAQKDENDPRRGLYLRLKDRLMFPIHNDYGDVLGFSGRQLRDDPKSGKYINTPETPLFKKSKIIFGLDRARKPMRDAKYALICEGQIDVIACHEAGLTHAVAGLGTAFTSEHARLLKRFTDKVILCYDADAAGIKASSRAFKELSGAGISVRYAQMPPGDDPDTYIQSHGADAFRSLIEKAPDFFDVITSIAQADGRLSNPTEKAAFAHDMADLLKAVSDKMIQDTLVRHVSTRIGIGADELRHTMDSIKVFTRKTRGEDEVKPRVVAIDIEPNIADLIQYAIQDQEVHEWLGEQGEVLLLASDLPGSTVLRSLLVREHIGTRPSALHAFLTTLPEDEQKALMNIMDRPEIAKPLSAATETLSQVSDSAYERHFRSLVARMDDPNLDKNQRYALMEEIQTLQDLLAG